MQNSPILFNGLCFPFRPTQAIGLGGDGTPCCPYAIVTASIPFHPLSLSHRGSYFIDRMPGSAFWSFHCLYAQNQMEAGAESFGCTFTISSLHVILFLLVSEKQNVLGRTFKSPPLTPPPGNLIVLLACKVSASFIFKHIFAATRARNGGVFLKK